MFHTHPKKETDCFKKACEGGVNGISCNACSDLRQLRFNAEQLGTRLSLMRHALRYFEVVYRDPCFNVQ